MTSVVHVLSFKRGMFFSEVLDFVEDLVNRSRYDPQAQLDCYGISK